MKIKAKNYIGGVCKSAQTGNLFTESEFIAMIVLTMGSLKMHHGIVDNAGTIKLVSCKRITSLLTTPVYQGLFPATRSLEHIYNLTCQSSAR